MAGYIKYYPGGSEFSSELIFDVEESEDVTLDNEVTDNPVEKGANVTDHVRKKPTQIKVVAVVSNTPSEVVVTSYNPNASPPKMEVVEAVEEVRNGDEARKTLERIHADGELVELFLGTEKNGRLYENMELQSLSFPRDAKTGGFVRFSAQFKEIRIVESQVVAAVKTDKPRDQAQKNGGVKPKKDASASDSAKAEDTAQHLLKKKAVSLFSGTF